MKLKSDSRYDDTAMPASVAKCLRSQGTVKGIIGQSRVSLSLFNRCLQYMTAHNILKCVRDDERLQTGSSVVVLCLGLYVLRAGCAGIPHCHQYTEQAVSVTSWYGL